MNISVPKVSVIVPNYNHVAYLPSRLQSVMDQSFQDFEVIILDDASVDKSQEILKQYENNPKVSHVSISEKNSGSTFAQWQKGLALASGAFVWIAESDDLAKPDFLKIIMEQFANNEQLGLVFTNSEWIDSMGNTVHKPSHEEAGFTKSGAELLQGEFARGPLIYNASSAVFKKCLIENVDFTQLRTMKYCGDWLFWVQIASKTYVSRVGGRHNLFRRHTGNVSGKAEVAGLQFSEGFLVLKYLFQNQSYGFVLKQKIISFWVNKLINSGLGSKSKYMKLLPWYSYVYILPSKLRGLFISFFQ
jgi:glycosyltransferase involved in cell wall biosynthesis